MFPGVPRGGNSHTPVCGVWGSNPRAFASDLKADSLTTRTTPLGRLPTHLYHGEFRPSTFFQFLWNVNYRLGELEFSLQRL